MHSGAALLFKTADFMIYSTRSERRQFAATALVCKRAAVGVRAAGLFFKHGLYFDLCSGVCRLLPSKRSFVYGCTAVLYKSEAGASSTRTPRYMTPIRSQNQQETFKSCAIKSMERLSDFRKSCSKLRICP